MELDGPEGVLERLLRATNEHDVDALASCFAVDYSNETPVHPGRGFRGREQVRRNWEQIFTFVPDVRAEIVASAIDGETVWTEWEMTGTRPDGSSHHMCGVIVFEVCDAMISAARFYLEPVDERSGDVAAAVSEQVER